MTKRIGLIAEKLGMTSFYDAKGQRQTVTVLSAGDNTVTGLKTQDKHGYTAVQLGFGAVKDKHLSKPLKGHFAKQGVAPKRHMVEFRVEAEALIDLGAVIDVNHFVVGQKVDVTGTSIGKGFAGAMKRHNFGGLRATHGVSVSHRSHGSTGMRTEPGRVLKGKRMAGHMGAETITTQNLEIVHIDTNRGLIFVKGSVPGFDTSLVLLKDAVKVKHKDLPFPAKLKTQATTEAQAE